MTPLRYVCLACADGEDWFISTRVMDGRTIEHCGRTFVRTSRRTNGGWQVYREES